MVFLFLGVFIFEYDCERRAAQLEFKRLPEFYNQKLKGKFAINQRISLAS